MCRWTNSGSLSVFDRETLSQIQVAAFAGAPERSLGLEWLQYFSRTPNRAVFFARPGNSSAVASSLLRSSSRMMLLKVDGPQRWGAQNSTVGPRASRESCLSIVIIIECCWCISRAQATANVQVRAHRMQRRSLCSLHLYSVHLPLLTASIKPVDLVGVAETLGVANREIFLFLSPLPGWL